ncbi:MAG: SigB/SigF/SigG family RNA polymerase sigma factor [Lachnospiraceae bacterium]|nr:SigB/SigF/SigG family RNA polymerase sigma factor [Lachnospiraceae bacterium]
MEWDDNHCLLRAAAEGDRQAREQLVEENVGLVWSVVRRFQGRGCDREDLFQIGSIGLLKAIDRFDFSYEVKFSTYAVPVITGEIRRFLRDDGLIRVSRSLREMSWRVRTVSEELGNRLGREPTLGELSQEMGVGTEELAAAVEASAEVESLYQPLSVSDGRELRLMDRLEEPEDHQEKLLNRLVLQKVFAELPENEKRLISLRYLDGRTQVQVAQELGISQVQVSRTEKKVLKKMRQRWFEGTERKTDGRKASR